VTYADDLVILCRKGKAEEALQRLREKNHIRIINLLASLSLRREVLSESRMWEIHKSRFDGSSAAFSALSCALVG
jgi:hypothetical protein